MEITMADAPKKDEVKKDETEGRVIEPLVVKLEAPKSTSKNEAVDTKDASEKKRKGQDDDLSKVTPVATSVAQLRDIGLKAGTAPSTAQVEEMRKIEDEANEKLSKQVRLPNSAVK